MPRIVAIGCAVVAFAMLSPAAGAQTQPVPETPTPPPVPEAEPLPPPPPFPPMPSARPSHRWVDIGDHRRSRTHYKASRSKTHHRAKATHHRRTHANTHHAHSSKRPAKLHFSRSTIRFCHKLKYSQIMRFANCRTLMKQDIATAAHKHAASKHHARKTRSTRRHSTKRRRR